MFVLGFAALATRLVMLQAIEAPAFAALAADQRERVVEFPARRGAILDRGGKALAISVDLHTVYADPEHVEDPVAAAAELAGILDRPARELEVALAGAWPGDRFEYLARQVTPDVARQVRELDLPGVYLKGEAKRYYPGGDLASHVLGFVDIDGAGLAGVELQYEGVLEGRPGRMVLEQDPAGRALPQAEFSFERPRPGQSLLLTIDKELQYRTQLILAEAVGRFSAEAGTAVVMRPDTGEILALANVPNFSLEDPGAAPQEAQRNRAVTDVYEPGSAFKIVAASAALEENAITPKTSFVVPDEMPYSDRVFHDSHEHATVKMTATEIIEQSSNVGTIQVGLRLGGERLDSYVRKFGFGSPTGLDFPGESPGIVLDRKDWTGPTIATIPIGQGIAVTPLQMAAAYSTIANGGVWTEPKLLYGTVDADGRISRSSAPAQKRVVSRRTAKQMMKILVGVTERGTGLEARVPGYEVAGKTGTAQKALPGGGYGGGYVASFGGYAPARDPKVVVMVVLDEPSPIWGGLTAAPTFRSITEFALRHLGASPSGNAAHAARELEAQRALVDAHD